MDEQIGDKHNHSMVIGFSFHCPECVRERIAMLEAKLAAAEKNAQLATEERDVEIKRARTAEAEVARMRKDHENAAVISRWQWDAQCKRARTAEAEVERLRRESAEAYLHWWYGDHQETIDSAMGKFRAALAEKDV